MRSIAMTAPFGDVVDAQRRGAHFIDTRVFRGIKFARG